MLVHANETEAPRLRRAMHEAGIQRELVALHNGGQAIHYLAGTGPFAERKVLPAFVLLDLKLPETEAFTVLAWRRGRTELARVPFLGYASTPAAHDLVRTIRLGAQAYVLRPDNHKELSAMMRRLADQWLNEKSAATSSPIAFPEPDRPSAARGER